MIYLSLKECVFNKMSDKTGLRVFWNGVLRLYNCHACCRRWYFTFNGNECSAPAAIDGVVYMNRGEGGGSKICTVYDKSKECLKMSPWVLCAWDSGSVTVLVTVLLMSTQVGTQCPGFTWKKYHPHRLEIY